MKYSIILFSALLPFVSFSQFREPIYDLDFSKIDSVTLVEYGASSIPFPKTRPIKVDGILMTDTIAHQKMLKKRYPNYKVGRDMPIPTRKLTIMDEEGRFYPNIKWQSYQTFPKDTVLDVLKILNCQLARTFRLDTITKEEVMPDGSIQVTESIRNIPPRKSGAMCFAPGFGIIVWSKGTVLQIYSVCFYCNRTAVGYGQHAYQQCIDLDLLKSEAKKLGYFKEK